jgi:hypothetical protein
LLGVIELAPLLDHGALQTAVITKILDGRRGPIPVVDVDFYGAEAKVRDLVTQSQAPQKAMPRIGSSLISEQAAAQPKSKAWRWVGLVLLILFAIWVLAGR